MKAASPSPTPSAPLIFSRRSFDPAAEIKAWCLERADEWYEQKELALARDFLKHALEIDPHDVEVWIALGSLQFALGSHRQALLSFTQARELDPTNAKVFLHLAATHQQLGENAEAEWHFKEALTADPKSSEVIKLYSGFLMAQNRLTDARLLLEFGLGSNLEDVELFLRLGVCCYRAEDLRAAYSCFKRVLQLAPSNATAIENLQVVASITTPPRS
ncbi:MAG TPA: tetratricopeptide repeat protein [Verrucomicrobiae bacterium]|nr:tetratricopeptide repeat protein [Verrucomicrobiae bacterium]